MAGFARCRLEATGTAPAEARALLARQLGGFLTLEQEQLAQLLVSELVTNALRHTQSNVILIDVQIRDRIRVNVTDESPRMPRRQSPGPKDAKGRGLIIVDELAEEWGIEPMPGNGKRIWFELPDADREMRLARPSTPTTTSSPTWSAGRSTTSRNAPTTGPEPRE